jgi:hypothetical protein
MLDRLQSGGRLAMGRQVWPPCRIGDMRLRCCVSIALGVCRPKCRGLLCVLCVLVCFVLRLWLGRVLVGVLGIGLTVRVCRIRCRVY